MTRSVCLRWQRCRHTDTPSAICSRHLLSAVLPWTIDDVHTPFVPTVLALGFLFPFCLGLFQEPRGGGVPSHPGSVWGARCRGSVTPDLNAAVTSGSSAPDVRSAVFTGQPSSAVLKQFLVCKFRTSFAKFMPKHQRFCFWRDCAWSCFLACLLSLAVS